MRPNGTVCSICGDMDRANPMGGDPKKETEETTPYCTLRRVSLPDLQVPEMLI